MSSAVSKLVQTLQSRIVGLNADPDIFTLPQNETDWSIFSHKLSSEPRIWIHTATYNNICYALRIGKSSYQSSLKQQWVRGLNAIRHVISNLDTPPSSLLHSRPNEVDFYRQCMSCFNNHQVLIYKTDAPQEQTRAQIHRILLPFYSRAHPEDGAPMFGLKAFSARLISNTIMNKPRVLIADMLPPLEPLTNDTKKAPRTEKTPPSILFSAFILSLRRIVNDDSQWDEDSLIGQIQGHDPFGNPLLMGPDTKRSLLRVWLSVAPLIPRNIPWHYESMPNSPYRHLYFSKATRSAFGPNVSVVPAKQRDEHYRIEGLWFFQR